MIKFNKSIYIYILCRLLNSLQIRLKQALQSEDIDTLREYGVYFDQIGQIDELVSIYCESKNTILTKYNIYILYIILLYIQFILFYYLFTTIYLLYIHYIIL